MPLHPDIYKAPRLPPGFAAEPSGSPWQSALRAAALGEAPGTVFHDTVGGVLDAAIILAPHRPVEHATALRLGMLALLDALAAIIPPETGMCTPTPSTIAVNSGEAARATIAFGPTEADGTPGWLVVGYTIRVAAGLEAPGLTPWLTDLAEEGVETAPPELLESLCRHLLAGVDLWQADGAAGIDRAWRSMQSQWAA